MPGSSREQDQVVQALLLEVREVGEEREEPDEALRALVEGYGYPVAIVPDTDVKDRAAVERGRIVGIGQGHVEVDSQLLVLLPVLEHRVRDADGRRLKLGLQMLVVGLHPQVLELHPGGLKQGQEGPVGVVQLAFAVAALQHIFNGDPTAHGAVVVEVDEARQDALQVLFHGAPVGRSLGRLAEVEVPGQAVRVVLMDDDLGRGQDTDLVDLLVGQLELRAHHDSRALAVDALVARVALARIVLEVEFPVGPRDRVKPSERLQEGGLPGLVLPDEARDPVHGDPARIVDALVVGDSGSNQLHTSSSITLLAGPGGQTYAARGKSIQRMGATSRRNQTCFVLLLGNVKKRKAPRTGRPPEGTELGAGPLSVLKVGPDTGSFEGVPCLRLPEGLPLVTEHLHADELHAASADGLDVPHPGLGE